MVQFHERWGERVENLTRDYLGKIAVERHKTADSLGARPTGILSRAAESPEYSATGEKVVLTIRPGEVLARAFRDVEIFPRNGRKWLTIPIHRRSYGKRAGEFKDIFFLWIAEASSAFLVERAANGNLIFLYLLVRKVMQKQDRTLLPSDEAYLEEGEAALEDLILEADEAANEIKGDRT
jgi:hypothetical protein